MGESLKDQIIDAKNSEQITHVNYFNDGSTSKDKRWFTKNKLEFFYKHPDYSLESIRTILCDAAKKYGYANDFDLLRMNLKMGLVFNAEDIDENDNIKANGRPLDGIVRIYTGKIYSYLNGEQINKTNYYDSGINFQGYVYYNDFVNTMIEEGLDFNGPASYEDFLMAMVVSVPFDISLSANLTKEQTLSRSTR